MHRSFFGTDGIRTTVGKSPLTPLELMQLGCAIATWAKSHRQSQQHEQKITIGLAYDTRISNSLIFTCLQAGLLQHAVYVHDLGTIATPALYYLVTQKKIYDLGIMITASHNQYPDNGLKIITQKNGKLTSEDEQAITDLYYSNNHVIDYDNLGKHVADASSIDIYAADLVKHFQPNFLEDLTLVIDCAHGAYSTIAPQILENFGAKVITLHATPNGKNINNKSGSQYPDVLQTAVITHHAHMGIAFDGDGDRITLVSQTGVLKDGDDIVALLLNHAAYSDQNTIIGTIMSNQGLEEHINQLGKKLLRTPVGDKNVMYAMQKECSLLGAEPSGHVLLGDFSGTSDGLFTALRVLEITKKLNNWELQSFKKFSQWSLTIPVVTKHDLLQEPFYSIIETYKKKLSENSNTRGRIIVRYSGTEPILRVMVEGEDAQNVTTIGTLLCQQLSTSLQ